MYAIEINNLSFKYKNTKEKILDNVNLKVNEGEILAIIGSSGCGKSTLCNCICGLIPNVYAGEYYGEVKIFGQNIKSMTLAQIATKVGIIFQNPATQLFSPTIEDELAFGPENLCVGRDEIGRRMEDVLLPSILMRRHPVSLRMNLKRLLLHLKCLQTTFMRCSKICLYGQEWRGE